MNVQFLTGDGVRSVLSSNQKQSKRKGPVITRDMYKVVGEHMRTAGG